MGRERDEIGRPPFQDAHQIPDFKALPGGDKQYRMPDMPALPHQRGHRHHAVRRDQRRFDKAVSAAQTMGVRTAAGLGLNRALHRIKVIERDKALRLLMQPDEKLLVGRAEPDGFAEARRQLDMTPAGHITHSAAEKRFVHRCPHCRGDIWLTEPVRVAELR